MARETFPNVVGSFQGAAVIVPMLAVGLYADGRRSEPGNVHPFRDMDLPLLPNYMDHMTSFAFAPTLAAPMLILASAVTDAYTQTVNGAKATAYTLAGLTIVGGASFTYWGESRSAQSRHYKYGGDFNLDVADISYGIAGSIVLGATFLISSLRSLRKNS